MHVQRRCAVCLYLLHSFYVSLAPFRVVSVDTLRLLLHSCLLTTNTAFVLALA